MQVHFRHPDRIKENWNARYIELLSWYSDVERTGEKPVGLLAKVGVEGSNPFARSKSSDSSMGLKNKGDFPLFLPV